MTSRVTFNPDTDDLTDAEYDDPSPRPAQPSPPPRDRTAERRLSDLGRVTFDEIVDYMAKQWPEKVTPKP